MEKIAHVLRHVHFEDLGSFEEPLKAAGYMIRYSDVGDADFCRSDPLEPSLLIILGGPIGVYEDSAYPFIAVEREFIKTRVVANRPTLGVCLGSQFIASALGATVFPSGVKEIGFSTVRLTDTGRAGPLRHIEGIAVLHWHADTYSLPLGAMHLASSAVVEQQAFSNGSNILGLQFHLEAQTGETFDRWLVGHAVELASAGIDVSELRCEAQERGPLLRAVAMLVLTDWLAQLRVKE